MGSGSKKSATLIAYFKIFSHISTGAVFAMMRYGVGNKIMELLGHTVNIDRFRTIRTRCKAARYLNLSGSQITPNGYEIEETIVMEHRF
jgi:hypothetical protein